MAKSAAQRQRERRKRLAANEEALADYRKNDRERKYTKRRSMNIVQLKAVQKKGKSATRRWREKLKTRNEARAMDVHYPYHSRSSFGKARSKVEKALPKSPSKKAAVVKRLVTDILAIELPDEQRAKETRPRTASALLEETQLAVIEFFQCESISRVMPGKADFVVVRNPGQAKTRHQKRHMVMTLGEAFELFKEQHPDLVIGKSKFAELRPAHVLLVSQMPHNTCGCRYHADVILLLESLHRHSPAIPLYSKEHFLSLCVCDLESDSCMSSNCDDCSEDQLFESNIVTRAGNLEDQIHWDYWGGEIKPAI